MTPNSLASAALALLLLGGCKDLSRFDTREGEAYCGSIVSSDFVRHGFGATLSGRLTIDTSRLSSQPGTLTTDDTNGSCAPRPLFDAAPLLATPAIEADALANLDFGRERDHNFVAWLDSTCRGSMLAIVSLMHDETVELRLLKRADTSAEASDTRPSGGDFGLLQLSREDCP